MGTVIRYILCLLLLVLGLAALALEPSIPVLNWTERSDWVNVKTDVSPKAVGDGVADDTAALQNALNSLQNGTVLYIPAGVYRITRTLTVMPKQRLIGVMVVGNGRDTQLVWDGPAGQPMLIESSISASQYRGLLFDGMNKAAVGMYHHNVTGGFETETDHRDMAFLNCTNTGLLIDDAPATAEMVIENCLFEECGRGVALLAFNDYDFSFDGCEFRRCGIGIECQHGNTYIRNTHFKASAVSDMVLGPEHGSSVRRCTSNGSQRFIMFGNGVAPLTVQDCQVAGWKQRDGAISINGAPVTIFDCTFSDPPSKNAPIQLLNGNQRLIVSQNKSPETSALYLLSAGSAQVYEIPAAARIASLTSAEQRFLTDTATVPSVVFDAKADFGARGDGKTDDTAAVQAALDAARKHGQGAIAYLPTGTYVITKTLKVTGADYTIGGTGFRCGLYWQGETGGTMMQVTDPQRITLENINVGSHDVAQGMTNAYDILQTGSSPTAEMTYRNVIVYGMYQRDPNRKGLWLRGLGKGAVVRAPHLQGNIHLDNAARATVLLDNSYEGEITVSGKDAKRDGFLGILTRLGTASVYPLHIRDNHSLVASDFYIEQADNGYLLEGSPADPPGRMTIQAPKLEMEPRKDKQQNLAFDIRGYHGQINYQAQFYTKPAVMQIVHAGSDPLKLLFWGCSFYNTNLSVRKDPDAEIHVVGSYSTKQQPGTGQPSAEAQRAILASLSAALDDLRQLGEIDLQLNHPEVLGAR